MKILIYCSVFVLLTIISLPVTAEAFSRRTNHSEVGPSHVTSYDQKKQTPSSDISPQAVPEPPVLLLMGIGLGLFAIGSVIARFRGQDAGRNKAL